MHKRTEITIETERLLVVSTRPKAATLWCNRCADTVPMSTVSEAARIECTTAVAISTLAEAGLLHFAVTAEGRLFICSNSLVSEQERRNAPEGLTATQHFDLR
jgi:hypothetical protein